MRWKVTLTRERHIGEVASIIVEAATRKEAEKAALAIAEAAGDYGPELDWEDSMDFDDSWVVQVDFCDDVDDGEVEEAEDGSDE